MACYPLLLPIYLAEFEYDQGEDGKRQFTIVMDAHEDNPKNCRVSWPPPPHLIERYFAISRHASEKKKREEKKEKPG